MTCPQCGEKADGNFCASCGAALASLHCTQCGAKLSPGSRFCTQCGAGVGASPASPPAPRSGSSRSSAGGGSTPRRAGGGGAQGTGEPGRDANLGWWAAAGLFIVLAVVFAWPLLRPDQVGPPPMGNAPGQAPAAGPGAVDLNSMTPRQAADRLFDRVMTAAESGDSAQALQFLPMAIQAYERAQPLDLDGAFHLSTLQRTGLNFQAALTTAQAGLQEDENHLLLLHAAAEAAREMGEEELADGFYRRILEVYVAEANLQKPAYVAHGSMLPSVRDNAANQVGG